MIVIDRSQITGNCAHVHYRSHAPAKTLVCKQRRVQEAYLLLQLLREQRVGNFLKVAVLE